MLCPNSGHKKNGGSLRGTIIFRFVRRPNVSRLSENSQDGICHICTWLEKQQKLDLTSVSCMWSVFFTPYGKISKGKKAVVRISAFGNKSRFKRKHRLKTY